MFWKRSCASSRGSTELSISDTTGAGSRLAISMKHSTSSLLSDHLSDILRIFTKSFSYKNMYSPRKFCCKFHDWKSILCLVPCLHLKVFHEWMHVEVLELWQHVAGDAAVGRLKAVGQALKLVKVSDILDSLFLVSLLWKWMSTYLQEVSDGDFVLVEHPVSLLLVVLAPG